MIFIMAKKTWYKHKKKLVLPKDYILMDGTEDDDAKLSSFTNCVTMDQYNPGSKLIHAVSTADNDDYDILDFDRIEKMEENYLEGTRLRAAIMATVSGILQGNDPNIFVILRNKVFKYYGKRILREFKKCIGVSFEFVTVFSSGKSPADYKDALHYSFTDKELDQLENALNERERAMEKKWKHDKKKKRKK